MNPIRAAIIDDETPARERIRFILQKRDDVVIVGEAENGLAGLHLIEREKPQLIFLDIQMPKLDGFGLLEQCSSIPAVVFISAYDEYALNAFEVNAIDYLLKPYTKERFDSAVEKVIKSLQSLDRLHAWEEKIGKLLDNYQKNREMESLPLDQITVKDGHSFRIFNVAAIDFFRMDEGLLHLYHEGEKFIVDTPLNNLEKKISPQNFFRVHRNSLINLKRIKKIIPWGNNKLVLDFGSSGKVHVSREKIRQLKGRVGIKL